MQAAAGSGAQLNEGIRELARGAASHAFAAREALTVAQHAIAPAGEIRAALDAQGSAMAELGQAMDVARRAAQSGARRMKDHAGAAAHAATQCEALGRAIADVEAGVIIAAGDATDRGARAANVQGELAAAVETIGRTLGELRGLAERTARSANDSSTVSASLQQRVAALS